MRDFQTPGRSVLHAVNGAAATSHPLGTLAAIEMLTRGGSAADAAVAAAAVQGVVEPQSTGIGGDCFVLYAANGSAKVEGLNGSGRAPAGLSADYLMQRGIERIEVETAHAVTIPGAVDAWARLLERHGRLGLETVLQPAIRHAEEGFAVTPRVAVDWKHMEAKLGRDASTKAKYLPGGRAPAVGDLVRLPELAATLRAIARGGRDAFYTGAIAEDMVAHLKSQGGTHSLEDFAGHQGEWVTPVSTTYRGREVVQIPPNGVGAVALLALNILEGFDLSGLDPVGPERLHLMAEATRMAFAARNRFIADPAHVPVPLNWLLSKEFATELRGRIDPKRAGTVPEELFSPPQPETVYITVVDRDRNACSFINSLFSHFGSGISAPKSGVLLQNRGSGFAVQPGHPNCVAPGKRPLHTIIPGMVVDGGRASLAYGVMGAAYQPVGHVQVLTGLYDLGQDPQEALDCPRGFLFEGSIGLERGIPETTAQALVDMGHQVHRMDMPHGGGQMIQIDWERGTLAAGSDPRKDGCALGY